MTKVICALHIWLALNNACRPQCSVVHVLIFIAYDFVLYPQISNSDHYWQDCFFSWVVVLWLMKSNDQWTHFCLLINTYCDCNVWELKSILRDLWNSAGIQPRLPFRGDFPTHLLYLPKENFGPYILPQAPLFWNSWEVKRGDILEVSKTNTGGKNYQYMSYGTSVTDMNASGSNWSVIKFCSHIFNISQSINNKTSLY